MTLVTTHNTPGISSLRHSRLKYFTRPYEEAIMVAIHIESAPPLAAADEFSNLVRQMNQLVDRELHRQFHPFSPTDAFRPAVNLYESQTAFLICVDLAGMDQNDIEVALDHTTLTVRGRRQSPLPPDGTRAIAVHLMEIDHGTFCRTIEVPANVQKHQIGANYHLGMLWITLPKSEA